MKNFWGLLKTGRAHRRWYARYAEAIRDVTGYIEIFYHRQQRQAALEYISPTAFARKPQEKQLDKTTQGYVRIWQPISEGNGRYLDSPKAIMYYNMRY